MTCNFCCDVWAKVGWQCSVKCHHWHCQVHCQHWIPCWGDHRDPLCHFRICSAEVWWWYETCSCVQIGVAWYELKIIYLKILIIIFSQICLSLQNCFQVALISLVIQVGIDEATRCCHWRSDRCMYFVHCIAFPAHFVWGGQPSSSCDKCHSPAMISPLTALQCVHMSVMAHDSWANENTFSWEDPVARAAVGKSIVKTFEGLMRSYDTKVTEEGVVVQATNPKRQRKGRRQAQSSGFSVAENQHFAHWLTVFWGQKRITLFLFVPLLSVCIILCCFQVIRWLMLPLDQRSRLAQGSRMLSRQSSWDALLPLTRPWWRTCLWCQTFRFEVTIIDFKVSHTMFLMFFYEML